LFGLSSKRHFLGWSLLIVISFSSRSRLLNDGSSSDLEDNQPDIFPPIKLICNVRYNECI
jgi:hypothetical protein